MALVVCREQEQAHCPGCQHEPHAEDPGQGTPTVIGQVPRRQTHERDSETAKPQDEPAHDRGEGSDHLLHCLVSFSKASKEPPDRFHS